MYHGPADGEDDLTAALWAAGTLGLTTEPLDPRTVRVEAWFAGPAEPPSIHVDAWSLESAETVEEQDWLAPWRSQARPFEVGERFLLDPREPEAAREEPARPGRRTLLHLPARRAFGVGSHETTRLVLEMLEALPPRDARVLDVGTGTGVLAFAALALGARSAAAFDVDPAAVFQARDNGRRNGFDPRLWAGPVAALGDRARFDLALVNVIPELIREDLPAVARRLAPGGSALVSGLLTEQISRSLEEWGALGFVETHRRSAGEWSSLRLVRSEVGA